MTYALLIYKAAGSTLTEAEEQRVLARHGALQTQTTGELRAVARLDDTRSAQTVRFDGANTTVSDGPYMESKEWLVGFYLLDCDNMQSALEHAKTICPSEAGHAIEVRPVTWTWKP